MNCDKCGNKISWSQSSYEIGEMSVCPSCYENNYGGFEKKQGKSGESGHIAELKVDESELENIILTTETFISDYSVKNRFGVVTAECAFGMNVFRDFFTGIRDMVGGKSLATQKILQDSKQQALSDLKKEAYKKGANAVIAIDLDYSEFSGGGKSMLFIVASGTAVNLEKESKLKA